MRVEANFVSQWRGPIGEIGPKPKLIFRAGQTVTREKWIDNEPEG